MMQNAISHTGFVNVSRLGIRNTECVIRTMLICSGSQIVMEIDEIFHEIAFKLLYVLALSFAYAKFLPRSKQVFQRNDIIVGMPAPNSPHARKWSPPPPGRFCHF